MTEPSSHCLLGQTITAIHLADDRQAIKFTLADGKEIVAYCDGDCCSTTWIEDVFDPDAALGLVTKAEDIELPEQWCGPTKFSGANEDDNRFYEEEMAYYGFAIETPKGRCTIAYRNSSNGYYGGSLVWPNSDYYYGGVFQQNVSKNNWQPLAEAK